MSDDTRQTFDRLAETGVWPSRYDASVPDNYNFIARRDSVRQLLGNERFDAVLDLGCGSGDYCPLLAGAAREYVGLDFSAEMIQQAARTYGASNGSTSTFVEGSSESIPFEANRFDLVCAIGFLEYLEDPAPSLREIRRVLRPAGTLIMQSYQFDVFRVMGRLSGLEAIKRASRPWYARLANKPVPKAFGTDRPYREPALDALVAEFGFSKVAARYSNYHLLPKTVRRFAASANNRLSEAVTPFQPAVLRAFAVNYVGRYRLVED